MVPPWVEQATGRRTGPASPVPRPIGRSLRRGCSGRTPLRPGELAPGRTAATAAGSFLPKAADAGGRTSRYEGPATASLPWGPRPGCRLSRRSPLSPGAEAFPVRAAGDRSWAERRGMRWTVFRKRSEVLAVSLGCQTCYGAPVTEPKVGGNSLPPLHRTARTVRSDNFARPALDLAARSTRIAERPAERSHHHTDGRALPHALREAVAAGVSLAPARRRLTVLGSLPGPPSLAAPATVAPPPAAPLP
jgi:hypothetical protein